MTVIYEVTGVSCLGKYGRTAGATVGLGGS